MVPKGISFSTRVDRGGTHPGHPRGGARGFVIPLVVGPYFPNFGNVPCGNGGGEICGKRVSTLYLYLYLYPSSSAGMSSFCLDRVS